MRQPNAALAQHVAARWGGEVARRDDSRVARRLSRTQAVEGGYRLGGGAVWDEFFQCLRTIGVMALLEDVHGAAIERAMVPSGQDCHARRADDAVRP